MDLADAIIEAEEAYEAHLYPSGVAALHLPPTKEEELKARSEAYRVAYEAGNEFWESRMSIGTREDKPLPSFHEVQVVDLTKMRSW